jgi:ABC-type Na+ transport system ATPase subunit NatA
MATDQLDALPQEPFADRAVAGDAVVTDRLTKYYGQKCFVNCLSIRVPKGSVYGLLGRNGAGKSTTIRILMGMVQADAGRATLLGEDAFALSPETRGRIAYLAEGHPLYRGMRIGEIARFTRAFYPNWDPDLFDQILDHFELSPKAKIRTLSRGQRAQVSLALAVAPDPELLVLDDPTLGLDTVADSNHPAPGQDDLVQQPHPGRCRARRRPDRGDGRRRLAGRMPDRPFQGVGAQDRAGV